MSFARHESRSGSELVFASLRALMSAYQLWGAQSRCQLAELSVLLHTSEDWLWGVMAYLDAEGLVTLDRSAATVALTPEAVRNLMASGGAHAHATGPTPTVGEEVVVSLEQRRPLFAPDRSE